MKQYQKLFLTILLIIQLIYCQTDADTAAQINKCFDDINKDPCPTDDNAVCALKLLDVMTCFTEKKCLNPIVLNTLGTCLKQCPTSDHPIVAKFQTDYIACADKMSSLVGSNPTNSLIIHSFILYLVFNLFL